MTAIPERRIWEDIEQRPQRQDSLAEQLNDLFMVARRLGMCDAMDWLGSKRLFETLGDENGSHPRSREEEHDPGCSVFWSIPRNPRPDCTCGVDSGRPDDA